MAGFFLDLKKGLIPSTIQFCLKNSARVVIRCNAYGWFCRYLIGRRQCVKVGLVYSQTGVTKSGVPQGSVSSAILFIIYIKTCVMLG